MHEKNILIKTIDGNLDCRAFYTNKRNNPGVIFYMDAPAIREELRVMCRKIAKKGYNVYLPNLFYRFGSEGKYPFNQNEYKKNNTELKKMLSTMHNTTNQMVVNDTKYLLEYLKQDIDINNSIGIVGYCMSGRFVVSCAALYSEVIKATASFYGVDICTKFSDSPHLLIKKIKGELYLAFAEKDIWVSNEQIRHLQKALESSDINYSLDIYPKTDHGFAFPSRSTYNKNAATLHWKKLFNLFEKNLKTTYL